MDDLDGSEHGNPIRLNESAENDVALSSKRKTKGHGATSSGKKSRRTMSFGALRVKPDSLKLSVVGYEDHECHRAQEENVIQVENEFDMEEDQVSLSLRYFREWHKKFDMELLVVK